jgi:3D (Asp-Asp-Asp) domain-containing protein
MQALRRMMLTMFTGLLCLSNPMEMYAQTTKETLHRVEQKLEQTEEMVEQKGKEKQSVHQEISKIEQDLASLHTFISKNEEALNKTQKKIEAANRLINQKKEEIVMLQDKILARKSIMKERLVALQHNDNMNLMISMFLEADSLADFIRRANAVTTLINADKDILGAQQEDLRQIEEDKKEIDRQEKILEQEEAVLAKQQAELDQNLQKREQSLASMQERYSKIVQQMALAEQEKSKMESQLKAVQEKIKKEQEEARQRAARAAREKAEKERAAKEAQSVRQSKPAVLSNNREEGTVEGKEMYVVATAYSHEETNANGYRTAIGYNIKNNPDLKLIAVDPSVIPLGTKVWVEGYGTAVAGDTGGAIKGHKIDVLMPTRAKALTWGRKVVKVVILD